MSNPNVKSDVRYARAYVAYLAAATILIVAGCGVTQKARSMFGGKLPFEVTVDDDANEDSPIAVDLVFVYDKKLLDKLLAMPSTEWFAKSEQLQRDHGKSLIVERWEWVPGQAVEPQTVAYRPGADRVVLFADYSTEGDHRIAIDPQEPFHLTLRERDFILEKLQ